ncbi:hypothetical protein ACFRI7_29780 [Streptomyces sp. NPDC056716]|uniref:hypothetical protein n=1 Tax=unclassified Streptomyces TaxID=2593676 RepID=UPI0036C81BD2
MSCKKVLTVAVLAAVFAWSTVSIVLGHAVAAAVLLLSPGLLARQIVRFLFLTAPSTRARPRGVRAYGPVCREALR